MTSQTAATLWREKVVRILQEAAGAEHPPSGTWAPTRASALISATPSRIMTVIAHVGSYPDWFSGVRRADILATRHDGRPERVRLLLGADEVRDEQVYRCRWDGDHAVTWTLVSSTLIRALTASYLLTPIDPQRTMATYQLSLESRVPLSGRLRRSAELVYLYRALPGLKHCAEHPDTFRPLRHVLRRGV